MNDPSLILSAAFGNLLDNLFYNDQKVGLYDLMAQSKAVAPYVILGPWVGRPANNKGRFGQSGEITLDINTRFTGGALSKKPANEIANVITNLLLLSPGGASVLVTPGFTCWNVSVGPTQEITLNSGTDIIFRKLITVNLSLTQNL